MKQKYAIYLAIGLVIFFLLVFYNYLGAQKAIRETKTSPLSIELVSFPETVKMGSRGTFIWHIKSSPDLTTSFTTIYWGYEASPGALPATASPLAVGYPKSQLDYSTGLFILPNTFDLRIPFDQAGKVYFRAYAKVKNDHLWSDEITLEVLK